MILVGSHEKRLDATVATFKEEGLPEFPFRCDLADPQQLALTFFVPFLPALFSFGFRFD